MHCCLHVKNRFSTAKCQQQAAVGNWLIVYIKAGWLMLTCIYAIYLHPIANLVRSFVDVDEVIAPAYLGA